jgi:NADPH2:quinone reductase
VDGHADGLRDRLVEANDGQRVDVVLEMVGEHVFAESLSALARSVPRPVSRLRRSTPSG